MEEALVAALLADASLAAITGGRIDWGWRAAGDPLPAVSMNVASAPRRQTYRGSDCLVAYRVQIDCWGATFGEAKLIARACSSAMAKLGRPAFDGVFPLGERDAPDTDATGKPIGRTILEFRIWHRH